MDELIIEEKKYISSKQAAKITGYAKDYIGQLCREGRVPARLVGRSWYVLETAIQDHRFGATDVHSEEKAHATATEPRVSSTWEPPHYEASAEELLPSVNRLHAHTDVKEEKREESKNQEHLQDTWKTWFDHIADTETGTPVIEKAEIEKLEEEKPVEEVVPQEALTQEVNIPIHTVYKLAPQEEPQPHESSATYTTVEATDEPKEQSIPSRTAQTGQRVRRTAIRLIQVSSVLFAVVAASIATIGSGYLDNYITSNNQVSIISGATVYNK